MNCREALDTLEAVEVGALPLTDAAVRDAERHRAACPACRSVWPTRQQWAHRLTEALPQVVIPVGLRDRLQAACAAPAVVPVAVVPARRRWMLRTVATVAALLLVALGLSWWLQPLPQFTEQDLLVAMTADLDPATAFTGRFDPQLPDLWKRVYELNRQLIRGFPTGSEPGAGQVAVVPFQFQSGDRHPVVRGRLLILRKDQFAGKQPATGFEAATVYYLRQGAYTVWTEEDLVFVCLVPSGPADLQRFQDQLGQPRSIT